MYVSVCVCLYVCLSVHKDISGFTRAMFTKFLCMLPMAVARSCFGVVAICYVLLVLWMHHVFYTVPYSGVNFATKVRFRLNLPIYR